MEKIKHKYEIMDEIKFFRMGLLEMTTRKRKLIKMGCVGLMVLVLLLIYISPAIANAEPECIETVNPAGKNVPPAGWSTLPGPKGGQNDDGFYQILVPDNPDVNIWLRDGGSGEWFKTVTHGTNIKYTQVPGGKPGMKKIGGPNSAVDSHIFGTGDLEIYVIYTGDQSLGGEYTMSTCFVPPPPK